MKDCPGKPSRKRTMYCGDCQRYGHLSNAPHNKEGIAYADQYQVNRRDTSRGRGRGGQRGRGSFRGRDNKVRVNMTETEIEDVNGSNEGDNLSPQEQLYEMYEAEPNFFEDEEEFEDA